MGNEEINGCQAKSQMSQANTGGGGKHPTKPHTQRIRRKRHLKTVRLLSVKKYIDFGLVEGLPGR